MINSMSQFEAKGGPHPRIAQLGAELRDAWEVIADKDAQINALKFKLQQVRDENEALSLDLGLIRK